MLRILLEALAKSTSSSKKGLAMPSTELVLANVPTRTDSSNKRQYVATPYQICKGVNAILAGYGMKSIPPQMLYRYASAGKFGTELVGDGRMQVDQATFEAWFTSYLQKKLRNSYK
jgi:hypothetical protein